MTEGDQAEGGADGHEQGMRTGQERGQEGNPVDSPVDDPAEWPGDDALGIARGVRYPDDELGVASGVYPFEIQVAVWRSQWSGGLRGTNDEARGLLSGANGET